MIGRPRETSLTAKRKFCPTCKRVLAIRYFVLRREVRGVKTYTRWRSNCLMCRRAANRAYHLARQQFWNEAHK